MQANSVFEITNKAIKKYGTRAQLMKLAEECSELSAAIIRACNDTRREPEVKALIEEVADVTICLEYARHVFYSKAIDEAIEAKLERLKERIKE